MHCKIIPSPRTLYPVHLRSLFLSFTLLITFLFTTTTKADNESETIRQHLDNILSPLSIEQTKSIAWLKEHNNRDVIAPLIYALRYSPANRWSILDTLNSLTQTNIDGGWFEWMLWQQAHPEVKPYEEFIDFQADLFARIDPNFRKFIYPGITHEIRMEEIAWGGVKKDGIPALTNPTLISVEQADYLNDDDLVFGVKINGDARAYPYRIMDWHEMFNDVIGGVPVSLAYCTLCGSGILYDTRVEGRKEPFVFGSSGFLYRSNKLMYDQATHSLWNQFTGRPVVGNLTGSGIKLNILPVATTSWKNWREQNPDTKVVSKETGYRRNYGAGQAYSSYFSSPDLMFPALTENKKLLAKDQVFGLRMTGAEKAWPLDTFKNGKVINDRVGVVKIVLIGNADTRTVRAYRSGTNEFKKSGRDLTHIKATDDSRWQVTENALIGPNNKTLPRLPGHLAYWFAWSGYLKNAEFSQ